MANEGWRTEFKRLWTDLVPAEGQADTVQGELIRAVGKLKDEAFRNGNQNFGKHHRTLCKFIRGTMVNGDVFSRDEIKKVEGWIDRILDSEHPDVLGPSTCFHHLFEMAVRWCHAHPELIPHEANSSLRI